MADLDMQRPERLSVRPLGELQLGCMTAGTGAGAHVAREGMGVGADFADCLEEQLGPITLSR
jgi:hypothetical protein